MSDHLALELGRQMHELIGDLAPQARSRLLLDYEDPRRRDWHYVPRQRPGLALSAMGPACRDRLWRLLTVFLSEDGVAKARNVLAVERILGQIEKRPEYRDPENYALVVFGRPNGNAPWSFRFEGHHLSLNVSVTSDGDLAVTPCFFGSNPAVLPAGHDHRPQEMMASERSLAFELIRDLSDEERSRTLLRSDTFGDILTGPGRERSLGAKEGIDATALSDGQRDLLDRLVVSFTRHLEPTLAERARSFGQDLAFAWAGALSDTAPHYFRISGPRMVIEYDNTQDGANHVHTVWHDPVELFGDDRLKHHHETDHPAST
ncbi:MAG: DUF3500 domain-containing protein [Geminicoccaceae bacterium]